MVDASPQMLEALRESEERYRALVELSPDGILVHFGGSIVFANTWVYTITALVCLRAFWVSQAVSVVALIAGAFALLYTYVLFRVPVDPGR